MGGQVSAVPHTSLSPAIIFVPRFATLSLVLGGAGCVCGACDWFLLWRASSSLLFLQVRLYDNLKIDKIPREKKTLFIPRKKYEIKVRYRRFFMLLGFFSHTCKVTWINQCIYGLNFTCIHVMINVCVSAFSWPRFYILVCVVYVYLQGTKLRHASSLCNFHSLNFFHYSIYYLDALPFGLNTYIINQLIEVTHR